MDHFGSLNESSKGSKHILIVIDAFTRFIWFFPKSTATEKVLKHLSPLFKIFGNPERVVSDKGSACTTSCEFSDFLSEKRINHKLIAVTTLWANDLTERPLLESLFKETGG